MFKNILIVISLLFLGCGEEESPFTWGNMAKLFVESACPAADLCGRDFDVELCITNSYYNMCEKEKICDVKVPELAESITDACLYQLANFGEYECNLMWDWGYLPSPCWDLLDYRPNSGE